MKLNFQESSLSELFLKKKEKVCQSSSITPSYAANIIQTFWLLDHNQPILIILAESHYKSLICSSYISGSSICISKYKPRKGYVIDATEIHQVDFDSKAISHTALPIRMS